MAGLFEQAGRSKGAIPVRGHLNGTAFIQTLVKYNGAWRLYINGPMLKAAGIGVGDMANIEIEFDPDPREVPMPGRFGEALKNDPTARTEFEKLSPSRQKEILRYLGHLKSEDSLKRNVEKILSQLAGKPVAKPHIAIRPTRNRNQT